MIPRPKKDRQPALSIFAHSASGSQLVTKETDADRYKREWSIHLRLAGCRNGINEVLVNKQQWCLSSSDLPWFSWRKMPVIHATSYRNRSCWMYYTPSAKYCVSEMYRAYMLLLLNIKSKLTLISLFSFHYKISYDISDIDQNVSIHISYRSIWPIRSPNG